MQMCPSRPRTCSRSPYWARRPPSLRPSDNASVPLTNVDQTSGVSRGNHDSDNRELPQFFCIPGERSVYKEKIDGGSLVHRRDFPKSVTVGVDKFRSDAVSARANTRAVNAVVRGISMARYRLSRLALTLSFSIYILAWPLVVDAASSMFWTDFSTGKIERANLDGSARQVLVMGSPGNPHGIVLDAANGHMYWTEYGADTSQGHSIRRANLNGTDVVDIVVRLPGLPAGLALDSVVGRLYWTDADERTSAIRRVNIDGTDLQTLLDTSSPRAIVLTTTRMYWTDWQAGTLESAALDGTDRRILRMDLSLPYGLAVDEVRGVIYWSDSGSNRIRQADLSGNDARDVAVVNDPVAIALDQFAGRLYWGDAGGSRIHTINTDGTSAVEILAIDSPPDATYGIALLLTPGPTDAEDCKNGRWRTFQFPRSFKNQGDCMQFVNTGK
jgi:DNA-binding beta-propeller fold protein YncE